MDDRGAWSRGVRAERLRGCGTLHGASALIGIPWLTFVLVSGIPEIGHFRIYSSGDDFSDGLSGSPIAS